jgi:hypothetical protein
MPCQRAVAALGGELTFRKRSSIDRVASDAQMRLDLPVGMDPFTSHPVLRGLE